MSDDTPRPVRFHTVKLPIEQWRVLLMVLQGVTWMHAPFRQALDSLQVQIGHYRGDDE